MLVRTICGVLVLEEGSLFQDAFFSTASLAFWKSGLIATTSHVAPGLILGVCQSNPLLSNPFSQRQYAGLHSAYEDRCAQVWAGVASDLANPGNAAPLSPPLSPK